MPRSIAYFSGSKIPSRAANSVHVMRMCAAFARAGHDVVLAAIEGDRTVAGDDFETYGVQPRFRIVKHPMSSTGFVSRLRFARAAPKLVRQVVEPDLVYGRHLLSLSVAARWGVPVFFEAHQAPSPLERLVERLLFRRPNFARLVVISEALRDEYRRCHPDLPSQRILVAPDAADLPDSSEDHAAVSIRREGRLQVGFVGHLYPGKGMEMVAALARNMPDVDFHVVGGTEADLARWRARTNGNGSNLVFHGHVPLVRTQAYRRAVDILLAPYKAVVCAAGGRAEIGRWMSPLKIFEYMASDRAMIVSDLPVLREIVTDGVTALLAPPDDVDAWVGAVERLRDPTLRKELAKRARAQLLARHTWERRAADVLAGQEAVAS
jgi:glycosyltransferase involved in cell wall biosynthesis